jgi:hypothetical protein
MPALKPPATVDDLCAMAKTADLGNAVLVDSDLLRQLATERDELREQHAIMETNLRRVLRQRQSAEECISAAHAALESLRTREGYRA